MRLPLRAGNTVRSRIDGESGVKALSSRTQSSTEPKSPATLAGRASCSLRISESQAFIRVKRSASWPNSGRACSNSSARTSRLTCSSSKRASQSAFRSLDPSVMPDPAAARQAAEDAVFVVGRLQTVDALQTWQQRAHVPILLSARHRRFLLRDRPIATPSYF